LKEKFIPSITGRPCTLAQNRPAQTRKTAGCPRLTRISRSISAAAAKIGRLEAFLIARKSARC